jgi:hypothetical protein
MRELCGKAGVNSVTLCHPLLYSLHVAPLERGRQNPRERYGRQPCTRAGWRRDVGLVERDPSFTSGPVRPSPPLCHYPRHCSAILGDVGARDDKTAPRPPLCIPRPSVSRTLESAYGRRPNGKLPCYYPRSRSWTGTGLATTTVGRRFVRTAINSTSLCATPPCVALRLCDTIVNRLPLTYKRRR